MISKTVNLLRKTKRKIKSNYFSTRLNALENNFSNKISRYKIKWDKSNKDIVLTQIVPDYEMCIKLAAASNHLAKKLKTNIGLYPVVTVLDFQIDRNESFRERSDWENLNRRMEKIFLSFGGKIIFRNMDAYKNKNLIDKEFRKIKSEIKNKKDILKINIDGIILGDLIYDFYLRMKSTPTVEMQDPYLDKVITETLHIFFNCKAAIAKYNIVALINSYTTYIHHGIMVRLLLKKNIPVYTVGGYNSILHRVRADYPSHQNDHFIYPKLFRHLKNKETLLLKAKESFESRFSGKIDSAIAYMRQSAFSDYHNPDIDKYDFSNSVVLLGHCFFDSPHIYRDLLFPDFYEWINFTLEILSKQPSVNVFVKPHPNGINGNEEIFAELEKKYGGTNIRFIDKKTSNLQLIGKKPKAMITAYGTAAAEFAYHDIPVLAVYDNPFTGYNFIISAATVSEYEMHLKNILSLKVNINKEQIWEYYFMQSDFFLNGGESDYLDCRKYKGETGTDNFLKDYLPGLDNALFEKVDNIFRNAFKQLSSQSPVE